MNVVDFEQSKHENG